MTISTKSTTPPNIAPSPSQEISKIPLYIDKALRFRLILIPNREI